MREDNIRAVAQIIRECRDTLMACGGVDHKGRIFNELNRALPLLDFITTPWTPVSLKPDADITVLVFNDAWNDPVQEGYLDGDVWRNTDGFNFGDWEGDEPTHWMHLPEPPSVLPVSSVVKLPWTCAENPFRCSGGIHGTSEGQVRVIRKFTLAQCRIAERLSDLGKVASKAVQVRIRKLLKEPAK